MSLFKVHKAVLKSLESIRGIFSMVYVRREKIAWVSWSKVLASKSNGGLGVSSFYALNRGLLFKWIWRFLSRDQSLCGQVHSTALHGLQQQVLFLPPILRYEASFCSSLRRDVRGGEESAQLSRISDLLDTVVLSNMGDRRFWDLNGDGCFRVKDVRRLLDDMLLPKSDVPSRWVKQIPIKVSLFLVYVVRPRESRSFAVLLRLAKDFAFASIKFKKQGAGKECFTLPGGVSGHIETISSSLIQIFEKMVFLKT
ncbi:hypothetical protein Tco_0624660 [Tanacetum coccineum]|uniref:RNA-directed DNA polymerase, eukaryota n=1 Tax=Tanacetum coccineum TaxID=301880 RepID=A0ABQ4WEL7_9ASTR